MRLLGIVGFLFGCLVVGVMAFTDPPINRLPPATADQIEVARARKAVSSAMREPGSEIFGPIFVGRAGHVCGMVNGKNGFGGMTGMKTFVFRTRERGLFFDGKTWNAYCAGVEYKVDSI